jgi:hypothetical protein
MRTTYSNDIFVNEPPTNEERRFVKWLIANGSGDTREYARQISQLRVVSRCLCGCPSVDFAIGDYSQFGPSEPIVRAEGRSPNGIPVWVMLHSRRGEIAELEVCSLVPHRGVLRLPDPESLTVQDCLNTTEVRRRALSACAL